MFLQRKNILAFENRKMYTVDSPLFFREVVGRPFFDSYLLSRGMSVIDVFGVET